MYRVGSQSAACDERMRDEVSGGALPAALVMSWRDNRELMGG